MIVRALVLLLLLFKCSRSQNWEDPWFRENPEAKEHVRFEVGVNNVRIYMEENIEGNIAIAFLTYKGAVEPQFRFWEPTNGANSQLGAIFERENDDDDWQLVITMMQDYENKPNGFRYGFDVTVESTTRAVYLYIDNVDDEPPFFKEFENPCRVDEGLLGPTNCVYTITDEDGIMDGSVTYTITNEGNSDAEALFQFTSDSIKDGEKEWQTTLETVQELDFEQRQIITFTFTVADSANHEASLRVVIEVGDMPDELPLWMSKLGPIELLEKTRQTYQVEAIDGDIMVNHEINYRLESDWNNLFEIHPTSGLITVNPIDRDVLQREVFTFTVWAFEVVDIASASDLTITVIVEDQNDNPPKITVDGDTEIAIPEHTVGALPFTIRVEDIDLGENAIYQASLRDSSGKGYANAFQIVPDRGYQSLDLFISVRDSLLLDFEDPEWREIVLEIYTKETTTNNPHEDSVPIKITLTNINDEPPVFEEETYTKEVPEDAGIGHSIIQVKATDRDVGDVVTYSLLGRAIQDTLHIDEQTGVVTTKVANAFDFERQQEVFVQVQAEDALDGIRHATIADLTITVGDVNDEPPRITVPTGIISIAENRKTGDEISRGITAADEDTDADLRFYINWDRSSAVKNGGAAQKETYEGCVDVITEAIESGNTRQVRAILSVNEIVPENTPNYESFDTLYLILEVRDENQKIGTGTDEVTVTVRITDENDNWPIFNENALSSTKNIIENAPDNTLIAMMVAVDADGQDYNQIKYSIGAVEQNDPCNWIDIDPDDGQLFVKPGAKIDADEGPVHDLECTVMASDGTHNTPAVIIIHVIDVNDNEPEIVEMLTEVEVLEKSPNGTPIQKLIVTDKDRDAPFNEVWFELNSQGQEVGTFFTIDRNTGEIYVDYKEMGKVLDRDYGTRQFTVNFNARDNYDRIGGTQLSTPGSFRITLLDVNDQRPIVLATSLQASEEYAKDAIVGEVTARDDDDEINTNNAKIHFEVMKVVKGEDANEEPPLDMFYFTDIDSVGKANLRTRYPLEGYYGTYEVHIKTNDLGSPTQTDEAVIPVLVAKYNFHPPQFVFPQDDEAIYLATDQSLNSVLYMYNGQPLRLFAGTDQQTEKWDLSFTIDPGTDPTGIFYVSARGKSQGELRLNRYPDYTNTYTLTVNADCGCVGSPPFSASATIHVRFIDETTEPYFEQNEATFSFKENTTGIEPVQLPKAYFNSDEEDWEIFDVYYYLVEDDSGSFSVDKDTAMLSLIGVLDRETLPTVSFKVVASKNPNWNGGGSSVEEKSILAVTITVQDVNDNPPNFDEAQYIAGVKPSDDLLKIVLQTTATDLDSIDSMFFEIVDGSLTAVGPGIQDISQPFTVTTENNKGNVLLNFAVKENMAGYFQFTMRVTDDVDHAATVPVQIYVVSASSRTTFKFENQLDDVILKENDIKGIMEAHLEYLCSIDTIQKATNDMGEQIDTMTDVFMHFIDSETNQSIEGAEIERISSDIVIFASLRSELLKSGLYLVSLNETPFESSKEELLLAWLIGISVALGTLCVLLIAAFAVKTRSLSKRLKKVTEVKFTSQESGLNHVGISAPNTNKHINEGSNPVYNDEKKMPDLDTASIGSGDSDLIGIEDNPNFNYSPQAQNVFGMRNPRINANDYE